jgi:hypothetical protein
MTVDGYRSNMQLMIRDLKPTHEVTIAYNNHRRGFEIKLEQVRKDLDRLHGLVDRRLYGPHFYKRKSSRRTTYIGCVEHKDHNLHIHLAWRVVEDKKKIFETAIKEIWCDPEGSRTMSIKHITDLVGWAAYMCKDLDPRDPDVDRMVIIGKHAII